MIGIAVNGKAVGGVIHQPYHNYKSVQDPLGRTLWGLVGLGVGGFTIVEPPSDKFIITTTRSHNDKIVQQALDVLQPDEILRVGGAGHKVSNPKRIFALLIQFITLGGSRLYLTEKFRNPKFYAF